MARTFETKGELLKDIITNVTEKKSIQELVEIFEERSSLSVTQERVRQVMNELSDEEKITIEKEIDENGNAVNFVSPKR